MSFMHNDSLEEIADELIELIKKLDKDTMGWPTQGEADQVKREHVALFLSKKFGNP